MAVTRDDVAALMKGIADPVRDLVRQSVQPLADLIVEQTATIKRLEQRIADLEEQATRP